ncbi:uncharacterized protein LOC110420539 [Herrania umbratica]|uniref:Uncharacterized protein LOC110420539 n=1 Tax=Herrania umbratica TaxID=108875 RepID=A0A6J1ARR4_9ROSI|nr:uncharacterized protein LOC110420539 [Herrania umbratica]
MADREQVKPLAPSAFQTRSDDEEALSMQLKLKKRRYIQCCGCVAALLLIQAVVILVLFFTVFRIQDPMIRLNSVTIQRLEFFQNGSLRTDVNVTLLADVSVKNPNVATFKFNNSTTLIYYGGRVVGEGDHLQGKAKPRRTLRRNVTVDIIPEKILAVPSLMSDIASQALNISSYTRISGRVRILNIIKKNVVVKFNCTMTYRLSGQEFHGESCRPELDY